MGEAAGQQTVLAARGDVGKPCLVGESSVEVVAPASELSSDAGFGFVERGEDEQAAIIQWFLPVRRNAFGQRTRRADDDWR